MWCFAVCLKIYCISHDPSTNITAKDCNKPWGPRDTFNTASSELSNTYTWTYSMIEFIRIHQQQISAYHTPTESRVYPALEPDKIRPSPQFFKRKLLSAASRIMPVICWSSQGCAISHPAFYNVSFSRISWWEKRCFQSVLLPDPDMCCSAESRKSDSKHRYWLVITFTGISSQVEIFFSCSIPFHSEMPHIVKVK